jgi:uncharacterized membrane protein
MFKDHLVSRLALPKQRLEALSDGVFAIVVTLVVLEIKVPDLPRDVSLSVLAHALRAQLPVFFSFVITFVISGSFWFLHQLSFHWIHRINRPLVFINIGFLMFVSLLPFSTGMLGHFLGNPVGQMFYFGNAVAIGLFLNLHWVYARKKGLMTQDHENALEQKLFAQRIQVLPAAFAAAFVISPLAPQFSGFAAMAVILLQKAREKRLLLAADSVKTSVDPKNA